jgi:hypothetical protein
MTDEDEIARFLGMEVIISPDICHPDVAWMSHGRRKSVAGRH